MTGTSDERVSHKNDFATQLIRLQQDGKEAISGPGNWRTPPLLEVATESDESIAEMIDAMVPGAGNKAGGTGTG